ncbi:MAG: zf-HC2 domain-containing protein [Myxococcota bacterium]
MSTEHTTHPSELTLERFVLGELENDELARVQAHLTTCDVCARVVSDLRGFELMLEPPQRPRFRSSIWARRRARLGVAVVAAACAVALVFAALVLSKGGQEAPVDSLEGAQIARSGTSGEDAMAVDPSRRPDPGDGVRIKSAPLELDVYVHDGASTRIVGAGETVHPGERVGFKVHVRERAGEFMIIGWDEREHTYLGFPQGNKRRSVHMDVTPQGGVELDQALQLDAVLGIEHLLAIRCDDAFSFEDAQQAIDARLSAREDPGRGLTLHGAPCHTHHTWLDKRDAPGAGAKP